MSQEETDTACRPIVDEDHVVYLDDSSYVAVTVIMVNGVVWPWLLDADHEGPDGPGCAGPCCAPHEGLGTLPAEFRQRIYPRPRCGATRKDGEPCRALVPAEGTPCRWHRTTPATQEPLW